MLNKILAHEAKGQAPERHQRLRTGKKSTPLLGEWVAGLRELGRECKGDGRHRSQEIKEVLRKENGQDVFRENKEGRQEGLGKV